MNARIALSAVLAAIVVALGGLVLQRQSAEVSDTVAAEVGSDQAAAQEAQTAPGDEQPCSCQEGTAESPEFAVDLPGDTGELETRAAGPSTTRPAPQLPAAGATVVGRSADSAPRAPEGENSTDPQRLPVVNPTVVQPRIPTIAPSSSAPETRDPSSRVTTTRASRPDQTTRTTSAVKKPSASPSKATQPSTSRSTVAPVSRPTTTRRVQATTARPTTTRRVQATTARPTTTQRPQTTTARPTSTVAVALPPTQGLRAFPGAEGFGANAVGGRGGRVIEVTNLNDSGSGSLRDALLASGPRTVVFRVGGTITLNSRIKITNPYLTIAGQTAPGDGITIRGSNQLKHGAIVIQTHDVIMRYLRVRPGPNSGSGVDGAGTEFGSHDVIIDHSSFSWTTDEVVSTWHSSQNITFQWNIFAEGLDRSGSGGERSKGPLLGQVGAGNISFHHNLMAHNHVRNPMIVADGIVDVRNNVIYNPGYYMSYSRDQGNSVKINYVNNYGKPGPQTGSNPLRISFKPENAGNVKPVALYVTGNLSPSRSNGSPDSDAVEPDTRRYITGRAHNVPAMNTQSAQDAYSSVLNSAGAILPSRDSVDARIVNDVRNGTGRHISDPSQVGGWPVMRGGTAPADRDHDGMPDAWEAAKGFNSNDPNDRNGDRDGDGYTNLEEYLNQTNP